MSRPAPRVNASSTAPEQAVRAAKAGEGPSTRAPQTPPAPGRDTEAARPRVNATAGAPVNAPGGPKAGEGRQYSAPKSPPARGRAPKTTRKDVTLPSSARTAGGAKVEQEPANRAPKTRPASGGNPAAGAEGPLPPSAPAGGGATAPYGRDPSGKALSINKARCYSDIPARADWTREQRRAAVWAVDRVLDGRDHALDALMPKFAGRQQGRDPEVRREVLEALAALGLIPDTDQPEGETRP